MLKRLFDFVERFVAVYLCWSYDGVSLNCKDESININFSIIELNPEGEFYQMHKNPILGVYLTYRGKDGGMHKERIEGDRKAILHEFYKFLIEIDPALRSPYMDEVFTLDFAGHYEAIKGGILLDREDEMNREEYVRGNELKNMVVKGRILRMQTIDDNTVLVQMTGELGDDTVFWDFHLKRHAKRYTTGKYIKQHMTLEITGIEKMSFPDGYGSRIGHINSTAKDGYYDFEGAANDVLTDGVYDYGFVVYAPREDSDEDILLAARIIQPSETHIAEGDAVRGKVRIICQG